MPFKWFQARPSLADFRQRELALRSSRDFVDNNAPPAPQGPPKYGKPFCSWATLPRLDEYAMPPYAFTYYGIRWAFYQAPGESMATVHRVSGGEHLSRAEQVALLDVVQDYSARRFGEYARDARKIFADRQAAARRAQELEAARWARLNGPIRLVPAGAAGVVFGTDVNTGHDLLVRVADIPHLLVVGTSGFGKSVFLHQLVSQLVTSSEAQQLLLVDLKGGVEFDRYAQRSSKVRVVWQYADVVAAVDDMVQLMYARQSTMKAQGLRNWNGGRVFFVVDEFAQVQLWPVTTKEEKTTHARVIADLTRLSMLGRSMGIVLVTAIQKPTADVMDSSFRGNLQGQVCFRIASRQLASSVFPALDTLPADPVTLPRGRCLFYNAYTGATQLLHVHVAPEAIGR